MRLMTREFARFGQVMADGGMWSGQTLIDPDFVTATITPHIENKNWSEPCGYLWWIDKPGG